MEENNIEIPVIVIPKIKVYIQTDINKTVTAINSSIFIQDTTGWIEIDEGNGDKYAHAQSQYLAEGLMDAKGRFNYKYDNALVELTESEKEILFPPLPPLPTVDEKIIMLEDQNLSLMLASAETYETMYQENVNLMLAVAELYETVMNGGVM